MTAPLTPIEREVLRAYLSQDDAIGNSDLMPEQPVTLSISTTLGELRQLHIRELLRQRLLAKAVAIGALRDVTFDRCDRTQTTWEDES